MWSPCPITELDSPVCPLCFANALSVLKLCTKHWTLSVSERGQFELKIRGPFHKNLKITICTYDIFILLDYTTNVIVCQQTIVTTTSSHYQSLVMFENTRNHKIMILVKRIFAPDIYL